MASGTNSALRELGGVAGVAVLATAFTQDGAFDSPVAFADAFSQALWIGAALSGIGLVAALLGPGRAPRPEASGDLPGVPVAVPAES